MDIFYGFDAKYVEMLKSLDKEVLIRTLKKEVCFMEFQVTFFSAGTHNITFIFLSFSD